MMGDDTEKEKFAAILKAAASATMPENMPEMMSPPLGSNPNQGAHVMPSGFVQSPGIEPSSG